MKTTLWLGMGLSACCLMGLALAQPGMPRGGGEGDEGQLPPPPPPPHPPHPIIAAIDADRDREISAEEIAGAVDALLTLDADGDGMLTRDELRPPPPELPENVEPGDHIMRLDADEDGWVTFDEFAAPLLDAFTFLDTSQDGVIDAEEAAAAPPPPPPPGHCGTPGGPGPREVPPPGEDEVTPDEDANDRQPARSTRNARRGPRPRR
jgi:hypothetical protein